MTEEEKNKKVFIIGRPNVGKSTLFNKILSTNRSITDKTYGVTRDLIYETCKIDSEEFVLVDTGGFTLLNDKLSKKVVKKVMSALEESDLILLVFDINEILYEDYEIAEKVRKYTNKIVLVINKVDSFEKESLVFEFDKLGFKRRFIVSATTNKGILKLKDFLKKKVGGKISIDSECDISIGIIGKPNSGKSALINYLAGKEISIVSDLSGTTRDFIRTRLLKNGKKFEFIDTAGIRRRSRVNNSLEYYSVSRALKVIDLIDIVFLLIDIKEGFSSQDKKIAHYAVKRGKGIIIIFTKWDLVEDKKNYFQLIKDKFHFFFPILKFAPVLKFSIYLNIGINLLFKEALKLKKQLNLRISTSDLNRMLDLWVKDYHLSITKHKVKYITQVSINPIKFILFSNKIKDFPNSYYNYIVNNLRKVGYKDIPIIIELREGNKRF